MVTNWNIYIYSYIYIYIFTYIYIYLSIWLQNGLNMDYTLLNTGLYIWIVFDYKTVCIWTIYGYHQYGSIHGFYTVIQGIVYGLCVVIKWIIYGYKMS